MYHRIKMLGTAAYLGGLLAVPEEFCWAWSALREFTSNFLPQESEAVYYLRARFSLHAHARNQLVDDMQGDWLWMTDTDHTFPPHTLYQMVKMMQQYNTPVLSGIYRHKVPPFHPMLWVWSDVGDPPGFSPVVEHAKDVPVFQVDAVGAGCLLIHRSVFEALAKAFPGEGPFDHIGKYGEDFSFCLRCRQAKIPIFATPLVESTHMRMQHLTEEVYIPEWFNPDTQADVPVAAVALG